MNQNADIRPEEIQAAARIALARQDFLAYSQFIDPSFKTPPHIVMLASYLQAVERGDIMRLIITMPPRHGKSETTSGKFPAWCIGRDPSRVVMMTSYGATLAETFSVQNRDTIADNPNYRLVFPNVFLDTGRQGKDLWAVQGQRETFLASGINGIATGFGAWLLIIDDPIKNYQEAHSEGTRELHWQTFLTVSRQRLDPNGRIILIMTRWHEDDLAGRILKSSEAHKWKVLHLPALSYGSAEDYEHLEPEDRRRTLKKIPVHAFPDRLGRPLGEPLWAEVRDKETLEGERRLDPAGFSALSQGNPTPVEGGRVQRGWFRPLTRLDMLQMDLFVLKKSRSWDLAWTEEKKNDRTASVRATLYQRAKPKEGPDLYREYPPVMLVLEDATEWRQEWDQSAPNIIQTMITDGVRYEQLVEAVAAQSFGFKSLRKDPKLAQHVIFPGRPRMRKDDRLQYTSVVGALGVLFVLYDFDGQPPVWLDSYLDELADFPNVLHDDWVDATSQLVNSWEPDISAVLHDLIGFDWDTGFEQLHRPATERAALPEPFQHQSEQPFKIDRMGWAG